jgi:hypothetical protein
MTDAVKLFVVAMTFGNPPNQKLVVGAELAVNQAAAVAIAVSKAHVDQGIADRLESLAVGEMTPEFIEAAHRGSAAPAPVLSIVPTQSLPCPHDWLDGKCQLCGKMRGTWSPPGMSADWYPSPPPDGAA